MFLRFPYSIVPARLFRERKNKTMLRTFYMHLLGKILMDVSGFMVCVICLSVGELANCSWQAVVVNLFKSTYLKLIKLSIGPATKPR